MSIMAIKYGWGPYTDGNEDYKPELNKNHLIIWTRFRLVIYNTKLN